MSQDQPLAVAASLESVAGGVAPAAVGDAPARDAEREIRAGERAPWTLGELPEPPTVKRGILAVLGPGLRMAGAAMGGGEWLRGPAVTAQYGGIIMWLALASILAQLAYNVGVMRYALYCGESIFVGYMRLLPGPLFWTLVYLFVDFFGLWPYLAANAAVPLAAALLGHLPGALPTSYLPPNEVARRTGVGAAAGGRAGAADGRGAGGRVRRHRGAGRDEQLAVLQLRPRPRLGHGPPRRRHRQPGRGAARQARPHRQGFRRHFRGDAPVE